MSWKRISFIFLIVLLAGISALGGAAAGGWIVYRSMSAGSSSTPAITFDNASATTEVISINTSEFETTITQAAESVSPAVVTVVGTIPGQMTFFGRTPDQTVSGSGFFISEEGYLLTNYHVIEDTEDLSVILADGSLSEHRDIKISTKKSSQKRLF